MIAEWFDQAARKLAYWSGSWPASAAAAILIVGWLIGGMWIGYGDTIYQLWINTATNAITFLMVFIIQHTVTHDEQAVQLKLDELIRAADDARNSFVKIEQRSEAELDLAEKEEAIAPRQKPVS
jgi:low affinity Fe/Cu permease